MVEPLNELNRICQKPDYKKTGNWYVRHIVREAALPMTWLLLHTRITANQVTAVSLAASLLGMISLAIPGRAAFLFGALSLQFWYYLDHVDGQIARYRGTASLTGRFLDFMTHHIVHTVLFFALGFYAFQVSGNVSFILWGFAGSLSIMVFNLVHDVKYKTFFEKLAIGGTARGNVPAMGSQASCPDSKAAVSVAKRLFSFAHKLCEIHVMMNLLTVAAILQLTIVSFDLRFLVFVLYGCMAPLIAVGKLVHIVTTRKIDGEYQELFGQTS